MSACPPSSPPSEPADAFGELESLVFGDSPLDDVLLRTAQLTQAVLPLPTEVSVTLIADDRATTPASTSERARELDAAQYEHGHGPCLASAQAGQLVWIPDTATETRWPEFSRAASECGVPSSLSVPLPVQRHVVGALNIYAVGERGFGQSELRLAETFGSYAAVAIATTALHMRSAQLAGQMQEAMASRSVIEQAKGILIAQRHCTPDDAFALLVRISQETNRKLREVAALLVEQTVAG